MYQFMLTKKYLTSKVMPLLAALSVMLCSVLVLVTWSVMGGFLTTFLAWGKDAEADVSISWPTTGFGHYEDLITRVEASPLAAAAAPVIESFGLITLPDNRIKGVNIMGVEARYARVTAYADSVWWKPTSTPGRRDTLRRDPRLSRELKPLFERLYQDGLTLTETDPKTGLARPAVVLGIELSSFSQRRDGYYEPAPGILARTPEGQFDEVPGFLPDSTVTINVLPLDKTGRNISVVSRALPVANEFRSGVFDVDRNTVLIRLDELQRMLNMQQGERLAERPADPYAIDETVTHDGRTVEALPARPVLGVAPARVTSIMVKASAGVSSEALREECERIYADFADAHPDVPSLATMTQGRTISTFEMERAQFINAVQRETAMVLFLLYLISLVAVLLILAIFWAMVSEKTKDVGILRAIGVSRAGVAGIWLGYGLALGVVGALLGQAVGHAIVWNINPIHEWLGSALGLSIWDASVYQFADIPNRVDPLRAAIVAVSAVLSCVLGALIPALRAAFLDPIRALRFE